NQVAPDSPEHPRPPLEQVLTVFSRPRGEFLPDPEDALTRLRFVIPGDGDPRGRLIVEALPGYRNEDRVPIWNLTFTSRLRVVDEGEAGALEALNLGREWAVQSFTEVITPEMQ